MECVNPKLFVEPQWGGRSPAYVFYRVLAAMFWIIVVVWSVVTYKYTWWKWVILQTDWAILLLAASTAMQAYAAMEYHIAGQIVWDVHLKVTWILYNISTGAALVISAMYWTVVYEGWELGFVNLSTHAMNSVFVLVDVFINAIPVRLVHIYQLVLYSFLYSLFTIVYWAIGGTGEKGHQYIYKVQNYSEEPLKAFGYTCFVTFVAIPSGFIVIFSFYKIRKIVYKGYCASKGKIVHSLEKMYFRRV